MAAGAEVVVSVAHHHHNPQEEEVEEGEEESQGRRCHAWQQGSRPGRELAALYALSTFATTALALRAPPLSAVSWLLEVLARL